MKPLSIRVLLVEEDDSYAGVLQRVFAGQPAVALTHLRSADLAARHVETQSCDVVLLDFGSSDARASARVVFDALKAVDPAPPVVAVIDSWDESVAVEALHAGAHEYLLEADTDPRTILRTIRYAIERERAEAMLRERDAHLQQSQKLEAIGRLAGGIAHDFSNLLTVIVGATDRLLEQLPPESAPWRDADAVRVTASRAVKLTQQILAFSRQQPVKPTILNLNELLTSMERFVRPLLGEDIDLTMTFAPELGKVLADRAQLEQVFLNLLVNARDATPAGGRLWIETRNATIESAAEVPGLRPGRYVVVAVIDSGHGMDSATRAKAFEPFFTTKRAGQGTGLGLSIAYGIVARAGGAIKIVSEPNAGTSMVVYLPMHQSIGAAAADAAPSPSAKPAGGDETILLVEDEDGVRELVREMLESAGFTVMSEGHPPRAEQLCREFDGVIHLLLTDVVMPEMSGRELAERVKAMRPDTKVLFMSGYPEHAALRGGTPGPEMPLLPKPFNRKALLQRVRSVLDASGA